MDSIKRGVKALLHRLKRDKERENTPAPDNVPTASHPQASAGQSAMVPESANPSGSVAAPQQESPDPRLETAYEHLAKSEPPADKPTIAIVADQGETPSASVDRPISKKENERPSSSAADNVARVDSTTLPNQAQRSTGRFGHGNGRFFADCCSASSQPHQSGSSPSAPVAGEASKSESKGDEQDQKEVAKESSKESEKRSMTEDLPPIKPIVVAPGMSATSGPLEEFPEGVDTQ